MPFQVALFICVFLAYQGCGASSDVGRSANTQIGSQPDSASRLTVAVIPKSVGGDFWETVEQGARDAAKDLNINIKWDGVVVETDLAGQQKIIENMVNLGVKGLALAPLDNRVMKTSVERVVSEGIPVVIFDSPVDGDAHVSYVGTDNVAGGALAARFLSEKLRDRGKRVFVLRYIQGTASTEQRTEGFLGVARETGLDIVADPYSEDATPAGGIKAAANTLERFVTNGKLEIDGMFATNLFSTLGLITALDNLRKSGVQIEAVVVGFDTSPKLLDDLQQGRIDALVAQNPHRIGYLAVETLTKHLRGEEVDPLIDTGVELVTRETSQPNVD